MARVLFYTGICLLCVSAALLYLPTYFSFILIGLLLIGLMLSILFHKKIRVNGLRTLLVITLAFAIFGTVVQQHQVAPAEALSEYRAKVVGTVQDWPSRYDTYSVYEVKAERIEILYTDDQAKLKTVPQNITLRLSDINGIDAAVFDRIEVEVVFHGLEEYRASSLANGVYAGGYIEKLVERKGQNRPFYACFYDLRDQINDLLYDHIRYDDVTVISAVLLGDRSRLSDDFESDARASGVTHALVVSGMHLGIIFQLLGGIFKLFRFSRRMRSVLLMGAIFALCAVCGFTPSVLRAGLTYLILAIGEFLYRRPDGLNSLGAAAILILFTCPFGFGNLSLLLSLLATFGLLYICPLFYDRLCVQLDKIHFANWLTKAIAFTLCQTLAATIATAPVCILCFGYVSLIAPITNLLIGFAITVIMVLSLLTVLLLCLPSVMKAAAALPIIVLVVTVRYVVWVVDRCAAVDFAVLPTDPVYLLPCGFLILAVLFLPLYPRLRDRGFWRLFLRITLSLQMIFAVVSAVVLYQVLPQNRLAVLDVGKGSAVVLQLDDRILVVGAGDTANDARVIEQYLLTRGAQKVDYLLLPALDKPMTGGAPELIERIPTLEIICPAVGDYADKLAHIQDERFALFRENSTLRLATDIEAITCSQVGTVINTAQESMVISVGTSVAPLLGFVQHKRPILICVSALPNDVRPSDYSAIVLSGDEETVEQMRKDLGDVVPPIYDTGRETVSVTIK